MKSISKNSGMALMPVLLLSAALLGSVLLIVQTDKNKQQPAGIRQIAGQLTALSNALVNNITASQACPKGTSSDDSNDVAIPSCITVSTEFQETLSKEGVNTDAQNMTVTIQYGQA
ncbi:MAG: hypothetical protein A3J38_07275 [Gammaproteobacteria bacterium RIFCSPHIGHO2_12_FULL_45_9]|nr:MAG: hypothetical protein A3J38_07275 [Gammaproteobacteria bacterium RIFCSPHIGHO2_12_FULL_45_9]